MGKSVDDLVAAIPESHGQHGCWAMSIEGDAAEFVEALKAKEQQTGRPLHRGAIIDKLRSEFEIRVGQAALVNHLKNRCRCA